jgi:Pectinacetylesterase
MKMQKRLLGVALLAAFGTLAAAQSGTIWREIATGLVCSDGSPWKFYATRGSSQKVIVDFQGGGACWDEASCDPKNNLFVRTLNKADLDYAQGIYNKQSNANPFKGWSHVFVPYCSGDLHWGNSERQYSHGKVYHQGAAHARAALEYTYKNFPSPKNVFVTGCSAGSYGAAMWSPHIMKHYNKARVALFGDSGLGVTSDAFTNVMVNAWQSQAVLPDFLPELAEFIKNPSKTRIEAIYKAAGKAFPNNSFAQFTANTDNVQIFFHAFSLGLAQPTQASATEWVQQAFAAMLGIKAVTPNYANYVIPGGSHCIIGSPEFYTTRVNNVPLTAWVNELISKTPADVIARP